MPTTWDKSSHLSILGIILAEQPASPFLQVRLAVFTSPRALAIVFGVLLISAVSSGIRPFYQFVTTTQKLAQQSSRR